MKPVPTTAARRSVRSGIVRDSTAMEPVLEGKAALVTGAAGGIGDAVARAFAEAGARVVGVDRRAADVVCDLSRADEAERAVAAAEERLRGGGGLFQGARDH